MPMTMTIFNMFLSLDRGRYGPCCTVPFCMTLIELSIQSVSERQFQNQTHQSFIKYVGSGTELEGVGYATLIYLISLAVYNC